MDLNFPPPLEVKSVSDSTEGAYQLPIPLYKVEELILSRLGGRGEALG